MSQETRTAIRNQAANAFVRHVASSDSNGHGRLGELPPGLDPDDALEHVTIDEGVEDPTADLAP